MIYGITTFGMVMLELGLEHTSEALSHPDRASTAKLPPPILPTWQGKKGSRVKFFFRCPPLASGMYLLLDGLHLVMGRFNCIWARTVHYASPQQTR